MKIAVIPARGGSKRIPRKNIKNFCGKPVIAYSITTALDTGLFDHVIVSTDDEEIASIAREYGAEVPFMRPAQLADDYTGTDDVARHALEWYRDRGRKVDYACCIYATAPLLESRFLVEGHEKLVQSRKSFAFSVTSFPFPIQRAIQIDEDGSVEAIWPENTEKRSQDLEEAFHDAGQFYWGTAAAFLKDVPLFSAASLAVVLPRHRVQDIDTLEDWKRAELMYKVIELEKGADGD